MKFAGKVALVTGASSGIGKAAALALAKEGADVAINFFTMPESAEELAASIRKLGRKAILLEVDVADQPAVEAMVRKTVEELGSLDVLVTCAAYSDRQLFFEANMDGFRRTIDVTMWGAFNCVRAAAQQMIAQDRGGSIVVVSSLHAISPYNGAMAYGMSKAAIDSMARCAAIELMEHRIRVNIVHPGWIDTPGERKFFTDEQIAAYGPTLPWGRIGRPEEVARGIVFLADPESDYITGSTFTIDGGVKVSAAARKNPQPVERVAAKT